MKHVASLKQPTAELEGHSVVRLVRYAEIIVFQGARYRFKDRGAAATVSELR